MFLHADPKPTPTKHVIYLCCTVVLGIMVSFVVHVGLESIILGLAKDYTTSGVFPTWYTAFGIIDGGCVLHPVIQWALLLGGAVGGFFLGRYWWKYVYIERRWAQGMVRRTEKRTSISGDKKSRQSGVD